MDTDGPIIPKELEPPKITLEITDQQARELMRAMGVYLEWAKHWQAERELEQVAEQIQTKGAETFKYKFVPHTWLARIRYGIKRVTVTRYEENPKHKPEGL
jgi:hypothetical protein